MKNEFMALFILLGCTSFLGACQSDRNQITLPNEAPSKGEKLDPNGPHSVKLPAEGSTAP